MKLVRLVQRGWATYEREVPPLTRVLIGILMTALGTLGMLATYVS